VCQNPLFQPPPALLKTRRFGHSIWVSGDVPKFTDCGAASAGTATILEKDWVVQTQELQCFAVNLNLKTTANRIEIGNSLS
jgi:hypothetical protein